ncbi:MAG: hypothetical protein GTO63_24775 [Anaerolineae bacterium]|nr:hypothetical protein [Anaerolineae bacterium]NIN97941.1 hypothetical protein [Anaerolineae bacterium]NIQ80908.1 hypothetical protein [Anaerolineae bacterium]
MNRQIVAGTAIFVVASSLVVGVAIAQVSANYDLSWHVIGGGGTRSTSGNYVTTGTIGQPVVGVIGSASSELCAGFWCMGPEYRFHLPVLLKNYAG